MIIKNALTLAIVKFNKAKIDSTILDAEVLLSYVLKKDKSWLYAHPQKSLTLKQEQVFKKLIASRARQMPVAYLTGSKEFFGYDFKVNKYTLVPRPLTEELVENALVWIKKSKIKPLNIADIGTGSGNITISLAKELSKKYNASAKGRSSFSRNFNFWATDISAKALRIAKANAKKHGMQKYIHFLQGDLLKPLAGKKIDLILANLPYLKPADLKEQSIKKEPKSALIGNYSKFFQQVSKLNPQPKTIYEDKSGIHIK